MKFTFAVNFLCHCGMILENNLTEKDGWIGFHNSSPMNTCPHQGKSFKLPTVEMEEYIPEPKFTPFCGRDEL